MDFKGNAQSGMTSSGGRKNIVFKAKCHVAFLAQYLFLKPTRADNNGIENDFHGQKVT